ncbi:PLP-dependent aminotransferase family protein [Paenibacillus sp. SC116]|uniref:aminotransferase-like domain-containing protein n=1 Tax=Paenibacillus sp. SC116 TaxID=2968986 RepID=UPI00215B747C|nr:PLP-dependent aminotransferase family protein [Paenibacillus sp. SC116]MCR8844623.1 PLP-dependent aminotransferase family protein [Paenibacillus sp. SC116]
MDHLSQWRPDINSSVPLYQQIEAYIILKIQSGEWTQGMKLPSQRVLAKQFGVNRSTIVAAMDRLISAGTLEGNSGGGTRVACDGEADLTQHDSQLAQQSLFPRKHWNDYVEDGVHYPNLPLVQTINRMEFAPHIIRLGTGELSPSLLPEQSMRHLFSEIASTVDTVPLSYEEPLGSYQLRRELCLEMERRGINASPSNVLVVSGALQALQLISAGLLERQSTILLEKPSYLYSIHAFQSAGIRLAGVPMDAEGLQTSALARLKHLRQAVLLYTNPTYHNPTGIVMSEARRTRLMQVCSQIGLPILEDGAYEELWLDHQPPASLKSRDVNGQVLYVGTLSKIVSPGLRIGWIVGSERVIERLADIKMQTDYGSSSVSQLMAYHWLHSGYHQRHMEQLRAHLRVRRDLMLELLQQDWHDIATWQKPTGGFYIWVTLNGAFSLSKLFEQALAAGILLNVGTLYDRGASRQLRLSYAYASIEEMKFAMGKLAQLIRSLG